MVIQRPILDQKINLVFHGKTECKSPFFSAAHHPPQEKHGITRFKFLVWSVIIIGSAYPLPGHGQSMAALRKIIAFETELFREPLDTDAIFTKLDIWKKGFSARYPDPKGLHIDQVSAYIFSDLGLTVSSDSIRFSSLVISGKGNCTTLCMLYYLLAEGSPLEMSVVHVPEHYFLRTYTDSMSYTNTEILQQGAHLPDSFYVATKNISRESIQNGIYMKEGDLDHLIDAYSNNLAVLLQAEGDFPRAMEIYSSSLRKYPSNPEIFINRGDCYRSLEQYDLAIRDYTHAINLYDLDPGYFERRGKAYVNFAQCRNAIDDFTSALEKGPQNEALLINRGKAYFNCQQAERACLDWAVAMKTGNAEAVDLFQKNCK